MATAITSAELINSMSENAGILTATFQKTVSAFEQLDSIPQAFSQSADAVQQLAGVQQILSSIDLVIESDITANLKSMTELITKQVPAWLSNNGPILLIGAAIGVLLLFLEQFGVSATDIIGWAGQFFTWLFNIIMQGVAVLMPIVQGLWDVFLSAIPVIGPLVLGLATALATYYGLVFTISLYQKALNGIMLAYEFVVNIARMAQIGFNMALTANPISLVIGLIVGLIVAFLAIIAAVKPVREFVADTFRTLGTIISTAVGWYIDMWTGFINGFIDGLNIFLSGINKVVNAVGGFLGIKAEVNLELEKIDSSKFKAGIKSGIESSFDYLANATENFNPETIKATLGLDKLTGNPASAPAVPEQPDPGMWNAGTQAMNISTVSEVGRVGKVDNPVDVSSEDLKTMRELAEMKNIQNFVTLTPTVSVQTGDIRSGYDVDTIIARITTSLEEQIVSTAKGVHA